MKIKKIIYTLILFLIISCSSKRLINVELKNELDEILTKDQTVRELFDSKISEIRKNEILNKYQISKEDFMKYNFGVVIKQDSLNIKQIEKIFEKYGYPGKSLVGEPTNTSA